jgi:superfamily II DNA helicase RecQ
MMLFAKTFRIRLSENHRIEDESLLNDFLESVVPKQIDSQMIHHPTDPFWSVLVIYTPQEEVTLADGERILFDTYEPLTAEEEILFMKLKTWRNDLAKRECIPGYMILHDAHLMTLVKIRPETAEDIQKLKGISLRKMEKYTDGILAFFRREDKK